MKIRYTLIDCLDVYMRVLQRLQTLQAGLDPNKGVTEVKVNLSVTNDEQIMVTFEGPETMPTSGFDLNAKKPEKLDCSLELSYDGWKKTPETYKARVQDGYSMSRDLELEIDLSMPEEVEAAVVGLSDRIHLLLTTPRVTP